MQFVWMREDSQQLVWFYLSILDLVLQGLLEEVEGVLLIIGLHHHFPGILHLNLQNKQQTSHRLKPNKHDLLL